MRRLRHAATNGNKRDMDDVRRKFAELIEELSELTDGFKVARIREMAGLTQEQFAYRIGVTVSTERRWEKERTSAPIEILPKTRSIMDGQ